MDSKLLSKKRERTVNFTREETETLVSLVETKKHIIENKKSDAVTWQEKENAWQAIEAAFNSSGGGTFRSSKNLKLKYEALKRDTRKKASAVRAELYKTGGGPSTAPPLTPIEHKVKDMILLSIEGDASTFDSDQLDADAKENVVEPDCMIIVEGHHNFEKNNIQYVDALDNANNVIDLIEEPEIKKKKHMPETNTLATASTSNESESTNNANTKWARWKPASLKSKKHPALNTPKEKRPFDRLAETKIEIANLQKKIIEEEIIDNGYKRQLLKMEIEHKEEFYKLEKEQMLLKIEILKEELENTRNKKKISP